MNIGNVKINSNVFLAPMASVTDRPFRTLCKMLGAGLTYTEMVSVKGLYYKSKKTEELLATSSLEHPCAVQLFGHEPEIFKSVIESGVLDKFDIIDINMGCPAPKIVKNGDGSALMKDLNLASQIIKACKAATNKPITVKFRKGFKKNDDKLVEFAKMCEQSGASAITIHPRTREDMFSGTINLEDIKKVKAVVNIAVIGNGDVRSVEEFNKMKTVCDAVMIGREAVKSPEIFLEILKQTNSSLEDVTFFDYYKELIKKGCVDVFFKNNNKTKKIEALESKDKELTENVTETKNLKINYKTDNNLFNDLPSKLQIIEMHLQLLKQEYSREHIVRIFKKYILSYLNGLKNATSLKKEIVLLQNLDEMEEKIFNFFNGL